MTKIPVRTLKSSFQRARITGSFSIRSIQQMLKGADMKQHLHRHDYYHMMVIERGEGVHEIDFNSHKITNRTIFFIRPGQVHQLQLKADSTGYMLQFGAEFTSGREKAAGKLLRSASNKSYYQLDAASFSKLSNLLGETLQEYTDKNSRYEDVIRANLDVLLISLLRMQNNPTTTSENSLQQEQLDKFLELLEANITEVKQVSAYAGMMNLSPYQLNSITRQMLGKNSSEVLNDYVILESKRYLLATDSQIKEIAWQLGYEDPSYFVRFFKKHTGYSPADFRNSFR
ncbi:helix-turn-helix domain-containing protein [Pseudoflavitalea sp. G-6-1-2]|uniref:helix-turn-helix domain-containing protein n=1 Tax=Pseudoflavitalea sp. G-6-1-2 TaxID=2728841 RepID=UPI00146DEF92|nr:AraC family transcriptional regulator [Pseudoflavitalea sp. G-6-1-2]NML21412.1 helix-turn-helix domain-containing protein [Pseudoflavitalea sp. G-6-1-2]